jgi:hypothetical protein
VHAFDATRKRMSMVVRRPDGQATLLIKGADNVMLERAAREESTSTLVQHLLDFSNLGLRTLVLAQRHLSELETERWHLEYKVCMGVAVGSCAVAMHGKGGRVSCLTMLIAGGPRAGCSVLLGGQAAL